MSRPKVENIENLWRNIEGPPVPSIPFKLEENVDDFESDIEAGENPFEGEGYGPPGTEPYNDPFDPNGDLGDYDAEVEIINLNKRVSREFSLSHYDVNIHEFGRLRAQQQAADSDGRNSQPSEEFSGDVTRSDEYHSGELNHTDFVQKGTNYVHDYEGSNDGTGSGHLICDCEDCINQTEAVDCLCENCVQRGETIPHTPPPGEITCDCDDCLNNSTESYSCDCENCRAGVKVLNNNKPEEICKCENCLGTGNEVNDNSREVCLCEKCCEEVDNSELDQNGAEVWGPGRFRGIRGSPQGSSGQFDLPRIEEVDQLDEYEENSVPDDNSADTNGVNSNHVTDAFTNELYTKLEKVKLGNGRAETENVNVFGKRSGELNKNSTKKNENLNVFSRKSNKLTKRDTDLKTVHRNLQENGNLEYENLCSHCEVGHSLDEGCAINILDLGHDKQTVSKETDGSCSCESCTSAPPQGHSHIVQPIAVNIEGLLEDQLQKAEKDLKKRETDYTNEIQLLQKENEKQQKIITQSLSLTQEAKIEATMQHEITRLTSENLDLREIIDKKDSEIRKLKKMIKHYAKRLKEGEAAEIQAELEKEEAKSVENVATIKHRERNYMGMLEYKKENESTLIKTLISDLRPKVAAGLLPGLPAYILFMCVRHTDYINDDEKVRSLLTSTINGMKKVVKKHHDDLDRVTLWLANTCRFLHTLKQYSGEKAFNQENTPRQNEHCLRNFDLAEYRQVFSDLAVWIYQTLIKLMEATIQPSIVAAVLEHEAIAGLSGSKPSGLRGRASSRTEDTPEYSLDTLMKSELVRNPSETDSIKSQISSKTSRGKKESTKRHQQRHHQRQPDEQQFPIQLNQFVRTLSQHAVDPELVKQIFRQLYYFIGASALNNLLLRKDMCNWSKGMQIRYNLSHLEQWLRDSKLQESGAGTSLEPIIQASQLLQARKTEADVESVCDMCSKLSIPQIVKILNLYTPVDEFEERVPISFIRKLQQHLKNRPNQDNHLLMDLKFSFSVTFPFNPSNISLESIDIPEQLHLTGVTKL